MRPADLARLLVLAALWGASFLFMHRVAPALGALPTSFFRALFAALGLAAWLAWRRRAPGLRGTAGRMLILGTLNAALPVALFALALDALPTGYMVILNATTPLMAVLVGQLAFGERAAPRALLGVALGMAGVAVLVQAGPIALRPAVWGALAACLAATLCYAVAGQLTQRWLRGAARVDGGVLAFGSQCGAAAVLAPVLAFPQAWGHAPADPAGTLADPGIWLALLALGLACTSLAFVLYFRLIESAGLLRAQTVTFLVPVFGVLWGRLFLGEALSWAHAGGGSLILLATWLILRVRAAPASPPLRARPGRP